MEREGVLLAEALQLSYVSHYFECGIYEKSFSFRVIRCRS